jgi:hypothetical protein
VPQPTSHHKYVRSTGCVLSSLLAAGVGRFCRFGMPLAVTRLGAVEFERSYAMTLAVRGSLGGRDPGPADISALEG